PTESFKACVPRHLLHHRVKFGHRCEESDCRGAQPSLAPFDDFGGQISQHPPLPANRVYHSLPATDESLRQNRIRKTRLGNPQGTGRSNDRDAVSRISKRCLDDDRPARVRPKIHDLAPSHANAAWRNWKIRILPSRFQAELALKKGAHSLIEGSRLPPFQKIR